MSGEPDNANPHARRMKEVFDFESHPGIALVRPEIAKQLIAACKPPVPCSVDWPIGSRSNLPFAKLYEMARSKRMEWSRLAKVPYYYHATTCSRKNGADCGHDCSGSWGFHAAEDAADIITAGWKPKSGICQTGEEGE